VTGRRCALVTGGGSGIGLAIARLLVDDGYGVTICGRDAGRLEDARAALGTDAHAVVADVAWEADVVALVRAHAKRWGRLDVLVNAAGIARPTTAGTVDTSDFDGQVAVNLRGPALVVREALRMLRVAGAEHGKATVINIASVAGKHGQPGNTIYSATKAGLISLTQSLQRETAGDGIQATALCPGLVATAMTENAAVPVQEMIATADVAEAVRFLLRTSRWCVVGEIVLDRRGAPG
jgi:NAD(P)-dependent dehydrogenase (short-subunit alcohol dehydrogenase family)